ncbi:MAG TPA: hypothetical protein PK723_05960, partial [Candidatus Pacearchaeota archaeon]|nr:hypothetical protein [Candidatus Pacearchaeota archaeon]
ILGWGVGLGLILYYIPPLLRKRRSVIGKTDLTIADISRKTASKDIKNVNKSIKEIDKFLKEHFNTAIELLFDDTNSFVTKDNKLNNLLKEVAELRKQVFLQFKTDKQGELKNAVAKANEYLVNKYGFSFDVCLEFVNKINNIAKEGKFLNFKNEKQLYDAIADVLSLEMGQVIGTIDSNIVETIKSFANDSQVKKALTSLPAKTKLQLYNFLIV